ncbi:hypothetical protein OG21DRAFT_1497956 [Imleria badia]|nr:hypothetical protein OG21DRAFT_1497956 [Imleria badia]
MQQNNVSGHSMGGNILVAHEAASHEGAGEADSCQNSTGVHQQTSDLGYSMGSSIPGPREDDNLVKGPKEEDVDLGSSGIPQSDPTNPEPMHSAPTTHTSATSDRKELIDGYIPNVIVFGETGVGKSSIINLIAGQKLAHTSNDALGCTFRHERHRIMLDKMPCALWDTTGLDEGTEGTVPARQAENNLRDLMQGLQCSGGIHLVIYCIRGFRLTKSLKRNYDLFYVTVCRKKVPVALVVTGLEYEQGDMETWWTRNEAELRQNGMRFDAHACVTTVDLNDHLMQQRRSDSRTLLRELVIKYIRLPAWKTDPSFISRVLPAFHSVLHGRSSTGNSGDTTIIRNVTVCGLSVEFLPGTTAIWDKSTGRIGNRQYEFLRVDKHRLAPGVLEDVIGVGAGVLVFYTSPLVGNRLPPTDVETLRLFYDCAGGQISPVVVVLRGCEDEKVARACSVQVASHHSDIRAHFISLSSTDDARAKLDELIELLCIEQAEVKTRRFKRYIPGFKFLPTFGNGNTPHQYKVDAKDCPSNATFCSTPPTGTAVEGKN